MDYTWHYESPLGGSGNLTCYAGGIDKKVRLLQMEQFTF